MNAVFDSNILIDLLNGVVPAREEVRQHPERAISIVTWIEVLTGAQPQTEEITRTVLATFQVVPISPEIAEQAVLIRRNRRLKLPDALLLATAIVAGGQLITRNTRDFPRNEKHVRIPYRLPVH